MTISELIERLQKIQTNCGDLHVAVQLEGDFNDYVLDALSIVTKKETGSYVQIGTPTAESEPIACVLPKVDLPKADREADTDAHMNE